MSKHLDMYDKAIAERDKTIESQERDIAELEEQNKSLREAVNHWKNDREHDIAELVEALQEVISRRMDSDLEDAVSILIAKHTGEQQ